MSTSKQREPLVTSEIPLNAVGIPSTWKAQQAAVSESTGVQTQPQTYAHSETQTAELEDKEVQTETNEEDFLAPEVFDLNGWDPNPDIADFIARVAPSMEKQLLKTFASRAFEEFDTEVQDEDNDIVCRHHYTVRFKQPRDADEAGAAFEEKQDTAITLPCTGVAWNASGTFVCASFGRVEGAGWGICNAGVAIWNVFSKKEDGREPDMLLPTMSSLRCVACHPEKPSVLAAGSSNGEVFVWDTNQEDPLIASSRIEDYFHREPIAKIAWMFDMFTGEYMIASVSGDGKVLLWTLQNKLEYPSQGFRLVLSPKLSKKFRKLKSASKNQVLGGTAIAFTREGKHCNSFLVGTEAGTIHRTFLQSYSRGRGRHAAGKRDLKALSKLPDGELQWTQEAATAIRDVAQASRFKLVRHIERYARDQGQKAVTMAEVYGARPEPSMLFPDGMDFVYTPHTGPVYALDGSPFHRNLFLSTGVDGNLNLYNVYQARPILRLDPAFPTSYLYTCEWSRVRPLVLAAGGTDGRVYVYDLMVGPLMQESIVDPVATLVPPSQGRRGSISLQTLPAVHSLSFNPKVRNLLAVGDGQGGVRVWRLGWNLSNQRPGEVKRLEKLVDVFSEDAPAAK